MAGRLNARLFSHVLLAGFVLVGAGFGIYRMAEAMMTRDRMILFISTI